VTKPQFQTLNGTGEKYGMGLTNCSMTTVLVGEISLFF